MAINDIVQTVAEARVDARSLSEFVFKPAGFKVTRRLAPTIDTLQFYVNSLSLAVTEAQGKVEYIETTVQDAINNTAVEGGVLADTFVVVGNSINQRQVNAGIESISNLLAIQAPTDGLRLHVKSRFAGEDVGGGDFIFSTSSAETDNGGTVFNATGGKWLRVFSGAHKVSWYAGSDSAAEDRTALVQKAIDATCRLISADALEVDGKYKITSSLMIDRMVDQTKGDYVIYANGGNNGFKIDTPITMFSSRIPYGAAGSGYPRQPISEFTIFKSIDFESTVTDINACVFDDKFLRLTFDNCTYLKIRGCKAAAYLQTIKWINHCKLRHHTGFFVECGDAYDVRFIFNEVENSGSGFKINGLARGCQFDDNLYQGCLSPFVTAAGWFGGSIDTNYFEQNNDAEIVLGIDGGVGGGYSISNNTFLLGETLESDPTFFPIQVGRSRGFTLNGNMSNGNLAKTNLASLFEISANGNTVPSGKLVMSDDANKVGDVVAINTTVLADAKLLRNHVNVITDSVGADAAVRLPKLSEYLNGSQITVINDSATALKIYPAQGERIKGAAYSAPDTIGGFGAKTTFYKSSSDYWVKV